MNYIIFDLEATCWDDPELKKTNQSEIIEIGAVKVDKDLNTIGTFQTFVKPIVHKQLSTFCTKLTSITQADVESTPLFPQAREEFLKWIGEESYWLCSWGHYDSKQLKNDCKLHKLTTDWVKNHISIKHQYATIYGVDLREAGMGKVLRKLGIKLEGTHHRADDDAKNITKIFKVVFPHLQFRT